MPIIHEERSDLSGYRCGHATRILEHTTLLMSIPVVFFEKMSNDYRAVIYISTITVMSNSVAAAGLRLGTPFESDLF